MRAFRFQLLLNKLVMKRFVIVMFLVSVGFQVFALIRFYIFSFLNEFNGIKLDVKHYNM